MVPKYYIVLFKNKNRQKIIKKFSNLKNAEKFYRKLIDESSEIIFEKKIESTKLCNFELALLQNKSGTFFDVYKTDELGRNIRVILEDDSYDFLKISNFKVPEKIFDTQKKEKIDVDFFIKNYLKGDGLKMISSLNNKIIVQIDTNLSLFTVKNIDEAKRFLDSISQYFYNIKRKDCMFIKDESTAQKKYLLKLLSEWGIDKKTLYQRFTTSPRPQK